MKSMFLLQTKYKNKIEQFDSNNDVRFELKVE